MMNQAILHRRTFLKGLGTAIALPLLESMSPVRAAAAAVASAKAPTRMAFLFVPNGVHMPVKAERIELQKFCPFCRKHTAHKEQK